MQCFTTLAHVLLHPVAAVPGVRGCAKVMKQYTYTLK